MYVTSGVVESYTDHTWKEYEGNKLKSDFLFKVGAEGTSAQIYAYQWPKIKQAIEEYNRWGARYTK